MPVRRAESLMTLKEQCTRSKQLGGFPTSDVFGFRQTRVPRPTSPRCNSSRQAALHRHYQPQHGSEEHSISYPINAFLPTDNNSPTDEQTAVGKRDLRAKLLFIWHCRAATFDSPGNPGSRCSQHIVAYHTFCCV